MWSEVVGFYLASQGLAKQIPKPCQLRSGGAPTTSRTGRERPVVTGDRQKKKRMAATSAIDGCPELRWMQEGMGDPGRTSHDHGFKEVDPPFVMSPMMPKVF